MSCKNLKVNDVYDFIQVVLTPGMVKFLLVLQDGRLDYQEIKARGATFPKKIIKFLGLTNRYKDENGLISYELTPKGLRVAKALRNLYETVGDVLPKGD